MEQSYSIIARLFYGPLVDSRAATNLVTDITPLQHQPTKYDHASGNGSIHNSRHLVSFKFFSFPRAFLKTVLVLLLIGCRQVIPRGSSIPWLCWVDSYGWECLVLFAW